MNAVRACRSLKGEFIAQPLAIIFKPNTRLFSAVDFYNEFFLLSFFLEMGIVSYNRELKVIQF